MITSFLSGRWDESKYGIGTASDLLHARDRARSREELDAFLGMLDNGRAASPKRMQIVLDAVEDEEWMKSVRHWHRSDP
jgi:hypothetical protein